jgi:glutamyl-tRNA synthetase
MSIITRFAPSPTGLLHIGNIRTALACYLFAKKNGGKFMLRLDDTDIERSSPEFANAIQADLKWMGLNWDIFSKQSERTARYEEIKQQLFAAGRLYPCYETPEEIEIKRKMQLSRGKPPIYDRAALQLTNAQRAELDTKGVPKHWRFKLDESQTIAWNDLIKGEMAFKAEFLSDPVLIRANGSPTYMLPSVIDDMDFNITHILRGEDHVSNTAIQIQIFEALGAKIPQFGHHSLMKTKEGKISKRTGGFDIGYLRDQEHIEPIAIASLMARLGTSEPVEPRTSLEELITHFELKSFTKTAAIYDFEELDKLNSKVLHSLPYDVVKNRPEMEGIAEEFWLSVRANLKRLPDIRTWHNVCKELLQPVIEDQSFTAEASTLLPTGNWNEHTWDEWLNAIKAKTGRKGKELFMPLRKALTALDSGPELKHVLPLIGYEKASLRLNGKKA